jgi:hypothetical protein
MPTAGGPGRRPERQAYKASPADNDRVDNKITASLMVS